MKKYLLLLVIFVLMISCNRYNEPLSISNNQVDNTEYYVKYSVSASYPYIFSEVKYADVHGTSTDLNGYQTRSWSVTIGPVKKGFRASVKNAKGTATDKIEVSKDGGPFSLKASGQNQASYTIGN